ncbi:ABC transporter permease [Pontibacter cellulosilyticus]|uniref:ABC transporter permease n=1 Tax=Pontibacter cellulosilyticus TaxID=1720253 RepID=A0A923N662_9BACT|nr:ABC transporter permease [Pontibacter cellulosilyticus]MBC5991220.1 ABC transporter permease [Pontibacter cellulosilyticus]
MIRHLFKLMWNRKRGNFLMIVEIFFSFLVLFGVSTLLLYFYTNASKPLGFKYDNVWVLQTYSNDMPDAERRERTAQLLKQLRSYPQIEHAALAGPNGPYTRSSSNTELAHDGMERTANVITVQDNAFKDVMGIEMVDGRWFNDQDAFSNRQPIVVTKDVEEAFFPGESAVGKTVMRGDTERTIIGVITAFKPTGEMDDLTSSYFERTALEDTASRAMGTIYIKIKPGTNPQFEEEVLETAANIGTGWTTDLQQMPDLRRSYLKQILIPMIIFAIVCAFLILNVALGLFGVLWHNINKRHSEIGLRRALGASASSVYKQFIGEIMVLATFGLVIGCFFAVQFPLLGIIQEVPTETFIQAILTSVFLIYTLVILCALYPSKQAAAIHPAIALHED